MEDEKRAVRIDRALADEGARLFEKKGVSLDEGMELLLQEFVLSDGRAVGFSREPEHRIFREGQRKGCGEEPRGG